MAFKARGTDAVARKLAEIPGQPPVYAYLFNWGAPDENGKSPLPGDWGQRFGAFHSLEIPFFLGMDTVEGKLLGSILFTSANETGRKALSGAMMTYIRNFARTGDPNDQGSGFPEWQAWSNGEAEPKCLVFDARGEEPDIGMMFEETTTDSINSLMEKDLEGETLTKVKNFIQTAW